MVNQKSAGDIVGKKFYGAFADAVAAGSAPRFRDIKAKFDNGEMTVDWAGRAVNVTFYLEDNKFPKAVVHTADKMIGIISSDNLGSLCQIIFWVDFSMAKVIPPVK